MLAHEHMRTSALPATGKDEGAFAWLTLNYLLGKLDGPVEGTVAAIDMGGGSIQEAFALTDEAAKSAPQVWWEPESP